MDDIERRDFLRGVGVVALGLGLAGCGANGSKRPASTGGRAFHDAFDRADGPVGNGWIDAHRASPRRQDPVGIASKHLTLLELQGPRDQDPQYSGWRGAMYRETGLRDGVSATTRYAPASLDATGGPLVRCRPDSQAFGIGCWYDHALRAWELGIVGNRQSDYQYLDFSFGAAPTGPVDLELRSTADAVAFYVDGELKGGPVSLPGALRGASMHGAQLDFLTDIPKTPTLASCSIAPWRGQLDTYAAPALHAGPVTTAPSAHELTLRYPAGAADDLLVAVITTTGSGAWSAPGFRVAVARGLPGALQLRVLSRLSGAAAAGAATFSTDAVPDDVSGVVLRVARANRTIPLVGGIARSEQSTTAVRAPSVVLLGLHRQLLWIGASPDPVDITPPAGFATTAKTAGHTPTLQIATRQSDDVPAGRPPFGYHGAATGDQAGVAARATRSLAGLFAINPEVASQ